jgi:homoserine acetyltransferase
VIRDFRLRSGEALPELRMRYLTFGSPQRDGSGEVPNAVLILHGTTWNSSNVADDLINPPELGVLEMEIKQAVASALGK